MPREDFATGTFTHNGKMAQNPADKTLNLLVLGASGGCGQWLIRLAQERGHHVRALVRPATPFNPPTGVVQVVQHFGLFSRTAHGDVAAWMLAAAERPEPFTKRTPMIATADRWRRQGAWSIVPPLR